MASDPSDNAPAAPSQGIERIDPEKPAVSRGLVLDVLTSPGFRRTITVIGKPIFMWGNRVRTRYISLPQQTTRPRRLVLVADFHAHRHYTSEKKLRQIVKKINDIPDVDFVALPGDFVSKMDPDAIHHFCNAFKDCQFPMYATLGNHDYDHPFGVEKICEELTGIGITLLTDTSFALDDELTLVGVDTITHEKALLKAFHALPDIPKSLSQLTDALGNTNLVSDQAHAALNNAPQQTTIVLGHEPMLATLHHHFLHLAGHTHWGQIGVPFIAKKMYPIGSQPYPKGLYKEDDHFHPPRWIYTTAGIGYHTPGRLWTPPEIAVIDF